MADLDNDPFAALRSAAASAALPGADAVRRRGERRTRNTRLLAATAALVVVAGGGFALTGGGGTETLRPPIAVVPTPTAPTTPIQTTPTTSTPPTAPTVEPSVAPTSPPAPASTAGRGGAVPTRQASSSASARAAATPRLSVTLTRTSAVGAAHVTYSARVQGLVPQLWTADPADGPPRPVPGDALTGTTVTWGDGSPGGGSDAGAVTCHPGAALVPVDQTFTQFHDFAPGTFTTTLRADACGISATDSVAVTAGGTAPGPATAFLAAGPVTSAGALRPGYAVIDTAPAENCSEGSDVGIPRAFRCLTGNGVYDPCFREATSTSELLCAADPFTRSVTRLTVAAPLGPPSGGSGDRPVWGLVLTGGLQCKALQGAHDDVDGRVVDYACTDGTLVLRGLDRSSPTWTAARARYASGAYTTLPDAAVTTAYYAG